MKKEITILFLVSLTFWDRMHAQTDTELWTGGDFNYKISQQFSVKAEQVFKFNDTISHFKSAFTEISLKYKPAKFFAAAGNYRFIENPPDKNAHRFSGDIMFYVGSKNFPLSFQSRHRFQHEVRIIDKRKEDYLRNKFTFDYNLTKLVDPFISYEPFFRFNGKNEFRIMRYTFGLDWNITQKWSAVTYYLFEKEVNVKNSVNTNIIGVMFSYTMKRTAPARFEIK